jgi:hypothetical protein
MNMAGTYPKSPKECHIVACRFADIRHIFEEFHYKHGHMGGGISFCLAMMFEDKMMGGTVVGKPRHLGKYRNTLEIRRMACLDLSPKYSESWFLAKTIRWIRDNTDAESVLSYADISVGHKGTIYQAANFELVGQTSESKHVEWGGKRYHMRSLTIDRPYSYELRKAVKDGSAQIITGEPKNIYIYKINRKKSRVSNLLPQ